MKISWNWLQDYIQTDLTLDQIGQILTSIGLEVESIDTVSSIKGGLEGFVIGEVLTCESHPNADKLKLTTVDLGQTFGVKNIVCGATNVAKGQKVVVATEGTIIYPKDGESFIIKQSKIRGELSQGMICAADEIGIGTSHDGILVLPESVEIGTLASQYFNINTDKVFEIGLTPNRTDAMSHQGVARDLATALSIRNLTFHYDPEGCSKYNVNSTTSSNQIHVINKSDNALVFNTCLISNVVIEASPEWIQHRLIAIGERPQNNIVDITNYILHDKGYPIHAYDYDCIANGTLIISDNEDNEEFIIIQNTNVTVKKGDICIKDAEKIIGLGGIIGSKSTEITPKTKNVLIEVAYFEPNAIRATSERLQLKTEAAAKFEKGVDPNDINQVMQKTLGLIAKGSPSATFSDINKSKEIEFPFWEVILSQTKLNLYAGMSIDRSKVEKICIGLGIKISSFTDNSWFLLVPRFKVDVTRDVDVIEEILRINGYDETPYPKFLKSNITYLDATPVYLMEDKIANLLMGYGYTEIMTNSISKSSYYNNDSLISLLNSMTTELDCMRNSLIPGFLEVIQYNINRGNKDLNLFEIGTQYAKSDTYTETRKLLMISTGLINSPTWMSPKGVECTYFNFKNSVELLISRFYANYTFEEATNSSFEYCSHIIINKKNMGTLGLIHSDMAKKFDIKQDIFVFELDMDLFINQKNSKGNKFKEISKYPTVKRDLSLIIDQSITYNLIENHIKSLLQNTLQSITLIDIFKDNKLGENKKSYAVRLTLQNKERTMLDIDIEEIMRNLIDKLTQKFDAIVRM